MQLIELIANTTAMNKRCRDSRRGSKQVAQYCSVQGQNV